MTIQLAIGCPLTARPGVMIAMSPTMQLKGNLKFSMKKLLVRGEMAHSTYTGPGELLLAPFATGDITALRLTGSGGPAEAWTIGRESFLACTAGVTRDYAAQALSKAIFSGEGLFVYKLGGVGICWLQSMGAIIRKDVSDILEALSTARTKILIGYCAPIASRRRKIHHRQRPPGCMELQLRHGARCQWWHY